MRQGRQLLNRAIRKARMLTGELHPRLVLRAVPTFLLETVRFLVMTLKLICFNGLSLMVRGLLGLMLDWMGCGLIRVCLIQIHRLDEHCFSLLSNFTAGLLVT
jgi:hypothetical protein